MAENKTARLVDKNRKLTALLVTAKKDYRDLKNNYHAALQLLSAYTNKSMEELKQQLEKQ
jgi:hypothetical protein